jgi:hypothetical protein
MLVNLALMFRYWISVSWESTGGQRGVAPHPTEKVGFDINILGFFSKKLLYFRKK